MGILLIALILALLFFRVSLVLILIAAAAYSQLVWGGGSIEYFVQDMWSAMDRELLLAIPLFVFVGQIMGRGSIANRLVAVVVEFTRPFPGGLAMATVLSCALFSAISGSSIVTMLAVGTVLYPALLNNGYSRRFALGALCAGGTLGIVIPPSLPMILYGIVTESSITDLFLAGLGPGILLTGLFSLYAVGANWHIARGSFSGRATFDAIREGLPALLLPVILLGGIYSGIFSPTEAAAVAILYAVLVELFFFREMKLADFGQTAIESGKLVGALFPLIAVAESVNHILTENRVPQELIEFAVANVESSAAFILIVNGLLLLMGCFMDTGSAIVISAPLLQPLSEAYGFSSVHLGIIMILNLEIGILTPPFGLNLIVAMTAFNEKFGFICRSVLPWIGIMLVSLMLVTFIPWIALALL